MAHPFEVTAEEIKQLNPVELQQLVNHLLAIEVSQAALPIDALIASGDIYSPDGGLDARVVAPGLQGGEFLPALSSAWQSKAGKSDWPDYRQELKKEQARSAVLDGDCYVMVLGRELNPAQRDDQEGKLRGALLEIVDEPRFILRSASQIATWVTSRPAAMFRLGHNMGGFEEVKQTLRLRVHQHGFVSNAERDAIRDTFLAWMEDPEGSHHLRLCGRAGVGKTRLALEAARQRPDAIYSRSPEQETREFIQWMVAHDSVTGVLVVDECSVLEAEQLAERAELSNGRVRLVTIGRDRVPGADWQYPLGPLDKESMRDFVHEVAPGLPLEQQVWVAELAGGYVKLARLLAAETVKRGAETPLWEMDLRQLLKRMVPNRKQRRALMVVSLMSHVGWEGDVAEEGKLIAKALGVKWTRCREAIAQLEDQELIGRAGRFLYSTPELLAIWSASDAWRAHGADLLEVRGKLDSS